MGVIKVTKGDSTNVQKITHIIDGTPVTDYSNYKLKTDVLNIADNTSTGMVRDIDPTGDEGFYFGLSPADTDNLGVGSFIIVADLQKTDDNGTLVFNREINWTLTITPGLRAN